MTGKDRNIIEKLSCCQPIARGSPRILKCCLNETVVKALQNARACHVSLAFTLLIIGAAKAAPPPPTLIIEDVLYFLKSGWLTSAWTKFSLACVFCFFVLIVREGLFQRVVMGAAHHSNHVLI